MNNRMKSPLENRCMPAENSPFRTKTISTILIIKFLPQRDISSTRKIKFSATRWDFPLRRLKNSTLNQADCFLVGSKKLDLNKKSVEISVTKDSKILVGKVVEILVRSKKCSKFRSTFFISNRKNSK